MSRAAGHHVQGARAYDQGLGGIESTRYAITTFFRAHRLQALHQPLHLDVVHLLAALVARGRIGPARRGSARSGAQAAAAFARGIASANSTGTELRHSLVLPGAPTG